MNPDNLKKISGHLEREQCLLDLQKAEHELLVSQQGDKSFRLTILKDFDNGPSLFFKATDDFFKGYSPSIFYTFTSPVTSGVVFFKSKVQQSSKDLMVFTVQPLDTDLYVVQRRKDFRTAVDSQVQLQTKINGKVLGRIVDISLSGFAVSLPTADFEALQLRRGQPALSMELWSGSEILAKNPVLRNTFLSPGEVKIGLEFSNENATRSQLIQQIILDVYRRLHARRFDD